MQVDNGPRSFVSVKKRFNKQAMSHTKFANDIESVDLSIFNSNSDPPHSCNDHQKCPSILRLAATLKYYSLLDTSNNQQHRDILTHFLNEVHKNLIDDYIHFIKFHAPQIEAIRDDFFRNRGFIHCNIKNCSFTARHHDKYRPMVEDTDDNAFTVIHRQILDSVHYHIHHVFDVGLRTLSNPSHEEIDVDTNGEKKEDEYYDVLFDRMRGTISKTNENTDSYQRFGINHNSKFTINTGHNELNDDIIQDEEDNDDIETFLDSLYGYLTKNAVDINIINDIYQMISKEQYETDTFVADTCIIGRNGNIFKSISEQQVVQTITEFLERSQMSVESFAVGLRFYYWDKYKDVGELPLDERNDGKISYHAGYRIDELYVPKKYDSFDQEMDNYHHIQMDVIQFKNLVKTKARKFRQTKLVKEIKANNKYTYALKRYDVADKSPLTINHLISVILYTDFTELSSNFTSTFRKTSPYETLSQIKARNRKYWWWSKSLRETVELFGDRVDDEYDVCYTGMSIVMNMPSFRMRLCSPTSTSTKIEVAIKFAGSQGMILQLQTKGIIYWDYVRAFDCSYISRYSEEEERLFMGGFYPIGIKSVRIVSSAQNYESAMKALCLLDCMLSDSGLDEILTQIKPKEIKLLVHLIKNYNDKDDNKFTDDYIYDTFQCFIDNKQEIHVIYDIFKTELSSITSLFWNKMEKDYRRTPRSKEDPTNLFKKELFEVFKNTKKFTLIWRSCYQISLSSLLSVIKETSLEKIILLAGFEGYVISSDLKEEYAQSGYKISWSSEVKYVIDISKIK